MDVIITGIVTYPDQPPPAGPVLVSLRRLDQIEPLRNVTIRDASWRAQRELNAMMAEQRMFTVASLIAWAEAMGARLESDKGNDESIRREQEAARAPKRKRQVKGR